MQTVLALALRGYCAFRYALRDNVFRDRIRAFNRLSHMHGNEIHLNLYSIARAIEQKGIELRRLTGIDATERFCGLLAELRSNTIRSRLVDDLFAVKARNRFERDVNARDAPIRFDLHDRVGMVFEQRTKALLAALDEVLGLS